MYICENCGEVFEECDTHYEAHPYGDGYAHEAWSCCPYCRDTDVVEAHQCEACEEYFASLTDGILCEKCYKESEEKEE
jgi:hypothetical protein